MSGRSSREDPTAMVPVVATLVVLALLACTEVAAEGSTVCDRVTCGQGTCRETPGVFPTFNCTCDPGATQPLGFPFLPCASPQCHFDFGSCFNLTLGLPKGLPLTNPCVAIDCGPGGECKKGDGWSYSCECDPGYVNLLNLTALPCVKNCVLGVMDCSKQQVTAPPSPPTPSTAPPPGNHDSSAPPTGPKGNATALGFAPSRRLLQLLMLLSLAMVQLV